MNRVVLRCPSKGIFCSQVSVNRESKSASVTYFVDSVDVEVHADYGRGKAVEVCSEIPHCPGIGVC